MATLMAACVLDCTRCDAYRATQARDLLAFDALAAFLQPLPQARASLDDLRAR